MSLNPVRPQRVGNLRHLIVWQELVGHENWIDRQTEPARVEPLKGREQFDVHQRYAEANYRIFTRYRHVPNTGDWRLLWITGHEVPNDDEPPVMVPQRLIMDIESVMNVDERRRFIEMIASNHDMAHQPPVDTEPEPEPEPEGDGELLNPGGPFTSTDGWVGHDCTLSVSGGNLEIVNDFFGRAVTPVQTEIGETYKFEVTFPTDGYGFATLGASNNSDGTSPFEESAVTEEEDTGAEVTFQATATTTYLAFAIGSSFAFTYRIASAHSERLS